MPLLQQATVKQDPNDTIPPQYALGLLRLLPLIAGETLSIVIVHSYYLLFFLATPAGSLADDPCGRTQS